MENVVLINGELCAKLSVFNRLTQFGDGVFETCLLENNRLLFWRAHFNRLEKGRLALKINPVAERLWLADITQAFSQFIQTARVKPHHRFAVKLLLSRGESVRGYGASRDIAPTRIVIVSKLPPKPPAAQFTLSVCPSGYVHQPLLAGIKHCNRLEQILARVDLHADECIMLGANQQVVSATQGNIFAIRGQCLHTPDLSQCGIAGTRREVILNLAKTLGLRIDTAAFSVAELLTFDAVFITSSIIGIQSVSQIIHQNTTQHFSAGAITAHIQSAFTDLIQQPHSAQRILPIEFK